MQLDPQETATLSLDFQDGIFGFMPAAEAVIANAAQVVETSRKNKYSVIHVGLGFEPGYPELSSQKSRFAIIKDHGLFIKGSASAQIHKAIFTAGDTTLYKQRYSGFSENSLQMILRAQGIENLVLFGISTSGIVLSTLRRAFDLDFHCVVVKDACFDPDEEVHRVLTEKVFLSQATVVTTKEFSTD